MKPTNLNPLFIDQVCNFGHLVTVEPQTKEQFMESVKKTYDQTQPKIILFLQATKRSDFETIRLNNTKDSILFNH